MSRRHSNLANDRRWTRIFRQNGMQFQLKKRLKRGVNDDVNRLISNEVFREIMRRQENKAGGFRLD